MNVIDYVVKNWQDLPKSRFNDDELVIVIERCNEDWGYGHHSYEGVGISDDGRVFWCYSSGCSCDGSCGTNHELDLKKFEIDGNGLENLDPESINFSNLVVSFSDY